MLTPNIKHHFNLVTNLQKMVTGLKNTKDELELPPSLDEGGLTDLLEKIEKAKNAYLKAVSDINQFFCDYTDSLELALKETSRIKQLLYSFYGPRNPVLSHFGLYPGQNTEKYKKPLLLFSPEPNEAA